MVIFHTLDHFLQELMLNPNEIFVHQDRDKCAIYIPETEEFLFLDGDFSGTEEECERELKHQLDLMGYAY
jgi:hypothetical protein